MITRSRIRTGVPKEHTIVSLTESDRLRRGIINKNVTAQSNLRTAATGTENNISTAQQINKTAEVQSHDHQTRWQAAKHIRQ